MDEFKTKVLGVYKTKKISPVWKVSEVMKKINVNIDEDSWGTTPVPSSILGIPNQENFNLIEVLIHIGMVTRHPEDHGININTYWAF